MMRLYMKPTTLERMNAAIAAGRPWRAKEIARGHIAAGWPGPIVSERFGQLLDQLGDRVEAGKFLFLSGARKDEYREAIGTFLTRYKDSGADNFLAQLPRTFRRQRFVDLPPELQNELRALGIKESAFGLANRYSATAHRTSWWRDTLLPSVAGWFILICLIVGIVVAFRQIVLWISAALG
jgi:hypothetical protein